jgi:hypothetical protein
VNWFGALLAFAWIRRRLASQSNSFAKHEDYLGQASRQEFRPYNDPKLRQSFAETYGALGLDPKTSTVADYLEEDDRVSFKKSDSAFRNPHFIKFAASAYRRFLAL